MPYSNRSTVVFSAARVKPPVRLLIDSNGTLATAFAAGQVHQSVTLALGDRIALAAQSTGTENGIYSVNASGAPTRVSDLPAGALAAGVSFAITNGTHKGKIYVCTNADGSDTVGTDALTFAEPPITVAWGDVGGTLSDQSDLQTALDAKAASSHNHDASDINAGTLAHERGGLEADVSAYDGLVRITGGATSAVTVTSFALTVLDDSDAATVRATIGAASSAEVSAITSGYSRRQGVIARVDNTAAPPTEVSGDRYLLDDTGASHADWDGAAANDIVEFDGSSWVATSPTEGWIVYSDGSDTDWLYVDDGSPAWNERTAGGGVTDHGALTGLTDDDHSIYSLADGTRWTTTPTASRVVISDGSGNLVVSSVSTTTLGYLDATSSIQTQLNGKAASSHSHTSGDVSDFSEAVDDRVAALLVAGTGISLTYDDEANTLTVAATGGSGGGLTVTKKTAGYTAANGDLVVCDATGGAFTVTMPATPSTDDRIGVYVEHGSSSLQVTVQGNGKTLAEFGSAVTMQTPGDLLVFQYDGVKWVVTANGLQTFSLDLLTAANIDEDADMVRLHDGDATEDFEKRATVKSMLAPYIEDSTLGTAAGDIVYRPTDNDHWTNLKIGARGKQLVVSDSDVPRWGHSYGITTLTDAATVTINLDDDDTFEVTLGGNRTIAISNPVVGRSALLRVIQDGTGSRTLTWPSSVKWPGGTAPTLTTTANASDWIGLKCVDAGTPVYHGFIVGQDYE